MISLVSFVFKKGLNTKELKGYSKDTKEAITSLTNILR